MSSEETTGLSKIEDFAVSKLDPQEALATLRENAGVSGFNVFDLMRISVPAGKQTLWEIPSTRGDPISSKEIEGIAIHLADKRAYWKDEYSGEGAPPDCTSDDLRRGVGDPGGDCQQCPFSVFGSDPKGGRGQACKQVRQLFILLRNSKIPSVLQLPPTSLKACRQFFLQLGNEGIPYWAVVMKFGIQKKTNAANQPYSVVVPRVHREIDPSARERIAAYRKAIAPMVTNVVVDQVD